LHAGFEIFGELVGYDRETEKVALAFVATPVA
jgi:hypothetical protein